MDSLFKEYFSFHEEFCNKFSKELAKNEYEILSNFISNKENIKIFHKKYIEVNNPKIVLCGMNPGRLGAGKTGIPFTDFITLKKLIPGIRIDSNEKPENSASFMFSIIEFFGQEYFYQNFHITNLSWFGYKKMNTSKNINYDSLPNHIQQFLIDKFVEEINFLNPKKIIALSCDVYNKINLLAKDKRIFVEKIEKINHPSWVVTYRRKEIEQWKEEYIKLLKNSLIK